MSRTNKPLSPSPDSQHPVLHYREGENQAVEDTIAVEAPLEIWLQYFRNGKQTTEPYITTMRTPGQDEALARGWMLTSGLCQWDDIQSVHYTGSDRLKGEPGNRMVVSLGVAAKVEFRALLRHDVSSSSCGLCGQALIESLTEDMPEPDAANLFCLSAHQVLGLSSQLQQHQSLFQSTGGSHGVGLFDRNGNWLDCAEDVGRHNAMDKVLGANWQRLPGAFGVVLSGRVSFEMVQKAAVAGISMIIAHGAPTSLALELAEERQICLVGFCRQQQFNLYTAAHRIHP